MNKFTQKFAVLILGSFVAFFALGASAFAQDATPGTDANGNPAPTGQHKLLVGLFGGALFNKTASTDRTTQFDYGGHIAIDTFSIGDFSKMAFGFSFDNTNLRNGDVTDDRVSYGTIVLQALFRKVAGSGLYFGPEAGFTIISFGNVSTDAYTIGGVVGYDWEFCPHLSISPEAHFDRNGPANLTIFQVQQSNMLKLVLAMNYHFE